MEKLEKLKADAAKKIKDPEERRNKFREKQLLIDA